MNSVKLYEHDEKSIPYFPFSDFKKVDRIASGGYGSVTLYNYKPSKKSAGTPEEVAIKKFESFNREIFEQEVLPFYKLDPHDNIVRILGVTGKDPNPQNFDRIVLEYMGGGSLSHVLYVEKAQCPLKDTLSWMLQASRGLEYMHELNKNKSSKYPEFIHRDIKPENMLLDSTRKVLKIADFGLSKVIENSENTPGQETDIYIAPEVLQRKKYDSMCDVYSFSLTFWECLRASFKRERPYGAYHKKNIEDLLEAKETPLKKIDYASEKLNILIQSGSNFERSERISMSTWRKVLEILIKNFELKKNDLQEEENVCVNVGQLSFFGLEGYKWSEFKPSEFEDYLSILIKTSSKK